MSKTFLSATVTRLRDLDAWAAEHTLALNLDLDTLRPPECRWLGQLYDAKDALVLSGKGPTPDAAVASLHGQAVLRFRGYTEA